ncbi:ABC-2 transporter permease (plasmid) [Niallia taxi]|uniref:ABC-2 transporter permease n=1 Tax=Niallia taxi TaxID=2499688 RepID=UPI0023A96430|nr:ABC-2 transporter permease [Niallia taxi]MDE5054123.1 ABC-2 transporter permease [Niallia taxi]WOD64928.1 ABC-2 transporter permease [Niallia taxi]
MYNLIRKDIVMQKKTLWILLPIQLVYLSLNIGYVWIGFVFSIVIIMNAFSMDEKSSINTLLNSLPYTRKEMVSSKYIGVLVFTFIVISGLFIGNLILNQELMAWKEIMLIISLVMIVASFILPFSYQFKSQYLLIASIVLFVIYMVIINMIFHNLNEVIMNFVEKLLSLQTLSFYLITSGSILILFACSWLLSIRIFKNKVL